MNIFWRQRTTWIACNLLWRVFFNLAVKGRTHVLKLKDSKVIFIGNHTSKFDAFFMGSNLPTSFWKISRGLKLQTFYKFIEDKWYGDWITWMGAYPVYPGVGGLDKVLAETVKMLDQNFSIIMFPQGKRHELCDINSARPGIAYLAKTTNATIVPVYIKNAYNIKAWQFLFTRRQVEVIYGKPFHYNEVADKDDELREAASKIMKKICELG